MSRLPIRTSDGVSRRFKHKQISAVATVPAAASVSANHHHADLLVFVNLRLAGLEMWSRGCRNGHWDGPAVGAQD